MARSSSLAVLVLSALLSAVLPPSVLSQFSVVQQGSSLPWNGRSGGGLTTLPYPLTYTNFSYVINATYPANTYALTASTDPAGVFDTNSGAVTWPYPITSTIPAGALYMWGGFCGHAASTVTPPNGDMDVWASADGGMNWQLVAGAHGISGAYGVYAQALSGSTPYWAAGAQSIPDTALFPPVTATAPETYASYPNDLALHDPVHRRFYLLAGETYGGSGRWQPSTEVQSSGGPAIASTANGAPLNSEAIGWTSGIINVATAAYAKPVSTFSARSSPTGTVDSAGNVYVMDGISAYSYTNDFAQALLADVWISSDLGNTWSAQTTSPPWATVSGVVGRFESGATSYFSTYYNTDILVHLGGCGTTSTNFTGSGTSATLVEVGYNDVHASPDRGITWYTLTSSAAWSGRCGMTAAAHSSGVLVVVGGRGPLTYTGTSYPAYYTGILGTSTLTDIWTSLDGGYTWLQLSNTGGRDRPAIAFDANGYLHIVGGRAAVGEGYSPTGCPSDAYTSSQSFSGIKTWINSVTGLSSYQVPSTLGVTVLTLNGVAYTPVPLGGGFSVIKLSSGLQWNGRSGAGLVSLPNRITYSNFSYVINSSYPANTYAQAASTTPAGIFNPTTGAQAYNGPITTSTPANSLFLWGGSCGHALATITAPIGDPDVWTSADGGTTWQLVAGAHGISGSYGIYAQALSGSTPYWGAGAQSIPDTALFPALTLTAPETYASYPNDLALHDPVNHKFYLLGGESYGNSGRWVPAAEVQSSGGTPIVSSADGTTVLNAEGIGWTSGVNNAGTFARPASVFPARSSASGTVDSAGNVYVMNGIATYSYSDDFAQGLLADVYMSADQGNTWTAQTTSPPWANLNNSPGRFESGAASYFSAYYNKDLLFVLGGCSTTSNNFTGSGTAATLYETGYNDVYASPDRGVTWYNITRSAPWSGRCGMTAAAASSGALVVVGGRGPLTYTGTTYPAYYTGILGTSTLTDIWTSLDGGYTWLQLSTTGGRDRPAIAFDANGYLHIVGGRAALGEGYSAAGCPSDSSVTSQSFSNVSLWINSVPGLSAARVPYYLGLTSLVSSTGAIYPHAPLSSTVAPMAAASSTGPAGGSATGYVCLITYTLPGSLDYPASVATSLSVTYNPTAVSTSSGMAVQLLSGSGVRTYTDRFGDVHTSSMTLNTAGSASSRLLYLHSSLPVDTTGLTFTMGTSVQLPGGSPSHLYSQLNVYNATGGIVLEQGSGRVDKAGQAYLSNIPGFFNVTIGASNLNALAPSYGTCAATITFTNGLRPFIEGNANNGAEHFNYSYTITDGATYTVRTTMAITSSTAFATMTDTLGNPYQPVIGVFGTRVYTHIASGQTLTSTITGLTSATARPVSQHWYPYSLLVASPGVYSLNTVPFLDADGIGFTVSPAVPANGQPLTSSLSSTVSVYLASSSPISTAAVTEYTAGAGNAPSIDLQQQTYQLKAF